MPGRNERSLLSRRPFLVGMAASAVVHALVLFGVTSDATPSKAVGVEAANSRFSRPITAMRAIDLTIVTEAAPEFLPSTVRAGQADFQPHRLSPAIASPDRIADEPSSEQGNPRRPVQNDAGWLPDTRLWTRVDMPPEESRDALDDTRANIDREVKVFHDSIAATRSAERRVTDWTRETGQGELWGASSGALHIGKKTLRYCGGSYSPVDCGIGVPPGKLEEYQSRVKAFAEIGTQQRRLELDAAVKERINAMRRNADVLRDSSRRTGGGG